MLFQISLLHLSEKDLSDIFATPILNNLSDLNDISPSVS